MHTDSTPYGGTSGWSGSSTSRERAEREDADGTTSHREARILRLLERAGEKGRTVGEVETALQQGHGSVSGALTRLHKTDRITRLTERRHRQQVYVRHEHVDGREEAPYRPNPARAALARVEALLDEVEADRANPIGVLRAHEVRAAIQENA